MSKILLKLNVQNLVHFTVQLSKRECGGGYSQTLADHHEKDHERRKLKSTHGNLLLVSLRLPELIPWQIVITGYSARWLTEPLQVKNHARRMFVHGREILLMKYSPCLWSCSYCCVYSLCSLVLPPFLQTASNQKLDGGKVWERGYSLCIMTTMEAAMCCSLWFTWWSISLV